MLLFIVEVFLELLWLILNITFPVQSSVRLYSYITVREYKDFKITRICLFL